MMYLLNDALPYLISLSIPTLIMIAFITLMERKIISSTQNRKGPNKTSSKGLLQPFADALKLFTKNSQSLKFTYYLSYFLYPGLMFASILCLWVMAPWKSFITTFKLSLFILLALLMLEIYCMFLMGWASNNKFSMIGGMRGVAQMLAFDINFTLIILMFLSFNSSLNLQNMLKSTQNWNSLKIFLPLSLILFTLFLIDSNRTPFDFSESESELVSGFNTEFFAAEFILIFMSEYGKILLLAMLFTLFNYMTFPMYYWYASMIFTTSIWFLTRASLPRFRYDLMMKMSWHSILPLLLTLFLYFSNF